MEPIQGYLQLISELEAEIARVSRLHGPLLNCRPGCSSCCTELSLLPLEAAVIRKACAELEKDRSEIIRRQAAPGAGCPFLHRRRCLIYPARPIICRTHGLPVAYVDPELEVVEVSACPHNFPAAHEFTTQGLLFLDPYNERLLQLNRQLAPVTLPEAVERIPMRHLLAGLFP
jgi:uncharacterized protein